MNYFYYIVLGILPSFIWLCYFLRKDVHPESSRMILKIFLYGMLATLPAILLEWGVNDFISEIFEESFLGQIIYFFIGVAFIEEFLKYLVVRSKVLSNPELDEPTDVILYMIIAALGFAAFENILCLIRYTIFGEMLFVTSFRFFGAIFLHALCSGTLGYFLALSFYKPENKIKLLTIGFSLITFLHGLFNYSIMKIDTLRLEETWIFILLPAIIIIGLVIFVSLGFKKLKRLKSVCKI
jgi:RsiW-degrading membrane proteinase PrsW (M82 family)